MRVSQKRVLRGIVGLETETESGGRRNGTETGHVVLTEDIKDALKIGI